MNTFATDNQVRFSAPNNGDRFEVAANSPLGRIYEITNLAVQEIGRHAVANPVEAVEVLSVVTSVDTKSASGLNVNDALRNAYKAHDDQFTLVA